MTLQPRPAEASTRRHTMNSVTQTILLTSGLLIQFFAIWLALKHFRARTAAEYMDRFSRPDMRLIRERIDNWIDSVGTDEARLAALSESNPPVTVNEIRVFANFFQELGLLCGERLMHRRTTRLLFDFLAPYYWGRLSFWVRAYRNDKNDQTLYAHFEEFANAMGFRSRGVS